MLFRSHPSRPLDSLEQGLVQDLESGERTVAELLNGLASRLEMFFPMVQRLRGLGLLMGQRQEAVARLGIHVVTGGLVLVAVTRLIQGLSHRQPILFLLLLLLLVIWKGCELLSSMPHTTDYGLHRIAELRRDFESQSQERDTMDPWLLGAFALLGATVLPAALASGMETVRRWEGSAVGGGSGGDGGGCGGEIGRAHV